MPGRRFDRIDVPLSQRRSLERVLRRDPIASIKDTDDGPFRPSFGSQLWSGECAFDIDLLCAEDDLTVSDVIRQIRHGNPGVRIDAPRVSHELYALPSSRFDDGGFEWEIILPRRPRSNVFSFPLRTSGLRFLYQPALTEFEIALGVERPDNVVGSYAVYHATKSHNRRFADGRRVEYETGKAFHIYRPEAIDDAGNRSWCGLTIDEQSGRLVITVPASFLMEAVYPVTIDPTFGYTTTGASNSNAATADTEAAALSADQYTASTGDEVTEMACYARVYSGSQTLDVGLYEVTSGHAANLALTGQPITVNNTTAAWRSVTGLTQSLSNGTTYTCAWGMASGTVRLYWDSSAGAIDVDQSADFPSTFTADTTSATRISVFATYTEASGGVVVSVSASIMDMLTAGAAVDLEAGTSAAVMAMQTAGAAVDLTVPVTAAIMNMQTSGAAVNLDVAVAAAIMNMLTSGAAVTMPDVSVSPAVMTMQTAYTSVIEGGSGSIVVSVSPAVMNMLTSGAAVKLTAIVTPAVMTMLTSGAAVDMTASIAVASMIMSSSVSGVAMPHISVLPAIMTMSTSGGIVLGDQIFGVIRIADLRVTVPYIDGLSCDVPKIDDFTVNGGY